MLLALLLILFLPEARTETQLDQARASLAKGDLSLAEQITRQYLGSQTSSADGHYLLGLVLFRQRNAKASLAEYTEGARYRKPRFADLIVVGSNYVLLEDYADADRWFTEALKWEPENPLALYYLGRTKYNENLFEEAINLFLHCLKLNPKNVKAESNLGLAYAGLGKTEEASVAYQAAIAWQTGSSSQNSDPYINLGALLTKTNRAQEAIPYLLQAVQISPNEARAHRELGKAYRNASQLEQAQIPFEKAVELDPQHGPTHFMLAQIYQKRGLAEKARSEMAKYAALTGAHSTSESAH